jgi:1-acyl-sn-glycerol-3-phosphate acyltransferase
MANIERERTVCAGISPWLSPLAVLATEDIALPAYFGRIRALGRENLTSTGPVLLAPTHRSRWDALLLPYGAGRRVTGRDCRFMVTVDEMKGLQGWFLDRLGCFPVNQGRPSLASLRYAVDLLADGQQLVLFPEGRIRQEDGEIQLQQGMARLALLFANQGARVPVIPVGIAYGHRCPRPGDPAAICFGEPLHASGQGRQATQSFTKNLAVAMRSAEQAARAAIGPLIDSP